MPPSSGADRDIISWFKEYSLFMKKWLGKIIMPMMILLVGTAAVLIGVFYFRFISEHINEDSAVHLREIYGQVDRSFVSYIEKNWGVLEGWKYYISLAGEDNQSIKDFIDERQKYWGFSDFYFLSEDNECMTPSGEKNGVSMDDIYNSLRQTGSSVMASGKMETGQELTVFAVPVSSGTYKGFRYNAIAVSYTNEDLAASLDVKAFDGEAKCFVVNSSGDVLLSTQTGGSVFKNYLKYIDAASDLTDSQLEDMRADIQIGASDIVECRIADIDSYILYQPIGYQNYTMISVVPQSDVSAGFLSVQKTTWNVLTIIFLLLGAAIITVLLVRGRKLSRKNKMELQYRELMFDVLSSNVDDIFIMLRPIDFKVEYISPNIERLLGLSVDNVRSDLREMEKCAINGTVAIPRDDLDDIPMGGNKSWECEYMHQKTGERRWYRLAIYRMMIQDTEKFIFVLSDRTQDKQLNQKLSEALTAAKSANEAKSNFLSNMSHDIRTPMNAIVGFSVLLEKDADQPEKVREYTRKITASSRHMLSLINDVLDMSKIESGKTSLNHDLFSLPELLDDLSIILLPQAKAKHQEFRIHVQGAPPEHMLGDKLRLDQILLNLLSNAVKYTPVGGNIDFTVSSLQSKAPQYAKLRFVVSDNGIGMSKEFQKQIFAPFSREISSVTNTIQGTGLGMAITKNLVDLMGGIISVESEPDKGSTFTVELSFALPEHEEADLWFRHKVNRVLVADDEEDVCKGIERLMRDTGVELVCVPDGEKAVEEAVNAHNSGNNYNVILLDWKMPVMNGVDSARKIRETIGDDVPILVLTSYDWSEIEDEARQAGIDAFMSKPFFLSTFWHTIKPLFNKKAADEIPPEDINTESTMDGLLFLVAEDNALNAEILTEMLGMEGASCELAVNGQQAVDMFVNSEAGHYDMIFMDVQMPVMNGYDATKAIRSSAHPEAKTIPIAAMTANTFAEDVRDALDAGMNGHLAKPIDMNAVKDLVGKLTRKKRRNDR